MPEVGPAVNYGKGQRSCKTNTNLYTFSFLMAHNDHGSARGWEGPPPSQPMIQGNHGVELWADLSQWPARLRASMASGLHVFAHAVFLCPELTLLALSLPQCWSQTHFIHQHFKKFIYLFWLRWILAAAVSRDYSLISVHGFLTEVASLVAERGF